MNIRLPYEKFAVPFIALALMAAGALALFTARDNEEVNAIETQNLRGWAFSEGAGWISVSSANCDPNGNGRYEGSAEGAPGACPASGTVIPYGVVVRDNGDLSGYAWSSNMGWLTFNGSETRDCPANPCEAKMIQGTGEVRGWARACSVYEGGDACSGALEPPSLLGGWDGWIHLAGAAADGTPYGMSAGRSGCAWQGKAWGNGNVGWVSASGRATDGTPYAIQSTTASSATTVTIDQPNGVINPPGGPVDIVLGFSEACGPVTQGDVDVRVDGGLQGPLGGTWANVGLPGDSALPGNGDPFTLNATNCAVFTPTSCTFRFIGTPGRQYEFRFRAR